MDNYTEGPSINGPISERLNGGKIKRTNVHP